MSRKRWYLNLGAIIFCVLSVEFAVTGNTVAAVFGLNCIVFLALLEDRNRELTTFGLALEVVRAEMTEKLNSDGWTHPDALSEKEVCEIVCNALDEVGLDI